jgi:hypothetical protein
VSSLKALFRGTKVVKHAFYSIGTKTMVGGVSEHFANLCYAKRCKTCVAGLNALFRGTKVVKHPFYSIGFKMIFGSVSEHFANLRHVRRCKTCVSGLSALFRGTKVGKHPFYSIGTKMMFVSVLEDFAYLLLTFKTCVRAWPDYFGVQKLWRIHSTTLDPNYVWEYFEAFRQPSACKKQAKLVFEPECTISGC